MTQYISKPFNKYMCCPDCHNNITSEINYKFGYPFTLYYCSTCRKYIPTKKIVYVEKGENAI